MIRLLAEELGGGVQYALSGEALVMGAVLPASLTAGVMDPELVHRELPSPNWDERALPVTMVVLHYTEMEREAALRAADAIPKPRSARITSSPRTARSSAWSTRTSAPGTPGRATGAGTRT